MSGAALVEVTFVDADSGVEFLKFTFPARQLPDSFAAQTSLNLGKDDWFVVEATPPTAAGFVASGKLRLVVRKAVRVDPRDLLFSIPTFADRVPLTTARPGGLEESRVLRLAEDDWLQLELVPNTRQAIVHAELAAIGRILSEQAEGPGFRKAHSRQATAAFFDKEQLSLDHVAALVGTPVRSPVAWRGSAEFVAGGFALRCEGGLVLYGEERDGWIAGLGLADRSGQGALAPLLAGARLIGVDWCRAALFP